MASTVKKLGLIIWKNLLLKRRHWFLTILEIVLPTLLYILLMYWKVLVPGTGIFDSHYVENVTTFPVLNARHIGEMYGDVLYAPKDSFTEELMHKFSKNTGFSTSRIHGVNTESDIIAASYAYDIGNLSRYISAGIVFESSTRNDISPPSSLSYKIRMKYFPDTGYLFLPYISPTGPVTTDVYNEFLWCQFGIDEAYIEIINERLGKVVPDGGLEWEFQKFPYPPYESVASSFDAYGIIATMASMFAVIGFLTVFPNLLRRIVLEKETGVKELMKMMGLSSWINWLGWFTHSFSLLLISITIMTILVSVQVEGQAAVFQYTDGTVIWFFLLLYSISGITFTFAVSSFFNRPVIATVIGILIWIVTYSVPVNTVQFKELSLSEKMSLSLLPNVALAWGFEIISEYEKRGKGLTWSTVGTPPHSREELTMDLVFLMLVIDSVLYLLLAMYVETVMPGQYGTAKPWYFLFTAEFWCTEKRNKTRDFELNGGPPEYGGVYESDPAGMTPGIEIHNLRKVFKTTFGEEKLAVDEVNLRIFKGQITALLGHNGAGKTTTMSMLTGLYSPSGGSAIVNGYDIRHSMDKVRESLGLCPQHNMLFPELTTREHLIFFGMLKGNSRKRAEAESQDMLHKLQFADKKDVLSSKLSGGMKRKLSLANALVGSPQVLMLDEPTSGLDPEARRLVWDLLQSIRGQKTIVLTTHFMEEADVLGDRIAIMTHGKIFCCGTSIFLKKLYGAGYQLTMTKSPGCSERGLVSVVQQHVQEATLKTNASNEISFCLPTNRTRDFPALFEKLEKQKADLGIQSFGVSITTMEQVFLKVGELADKDRGNPEAEVSGSGNYGSRGSRIMETSHEQPLTYDHLKGFSLAKQRVIAMLTRKILYVYRRIFFFLSMVVLSIAMVIMCVVLLNIVQANDTTQISPRVINLKDYGNTYTLVNYSQPSEVTNIASKYLHLPVFEGDSSVEETNSIADELVRVGKANDQKYREQYIVAAFFREENGAIISRAMYNSVPLHALPISLNLIDNALLQYIGQADDYSIKVTNHPLPKNAKYAFMDAANGSGVAGAFLFGIFLPIGLSFLTASFLILPNKERVCGAKQLQLMTGVSLVPFWMTSFLCDFLIYLFAASFMILFIGVLDNTGNFTNHDTLGAVFLCLFLYGWSAITMAYCLSFKTKTGAGGFALMMLINIVTGIVFSIATWLFGMAGGNKTIDIVKWFLRLFPTFTVSYAFINIANLASTNNQCHIIPKDAMDALCDMAPSPHEAYFGCCEKLCKPLNRCFKPTPLLNWESPAVGQDILFLAVDGFIFLLLLYVNECGILLKLMHWVHLYMSNIQIQESTSLDIDVAEEKQRVSRLLDIERTGDDVLLVKNLTRHFGSVTAVDCLSFGVHYGECFGLLGINGAGKTTTFRMLTGDEILSGGNAYLLSRNLANERSKFLENVGYCPQFDALLDVLTGREILSFFGRIRGIPSTGINTEVEKLLNLLGLDEYADRMCGTYSGGNKRKLSTAIALIGDPPVIFLDEPTSGVDPVSRRKLWDVLTMMQHSGQSIILTSHSMEECEALCSRLSIMVNGQFQCLGGKQYLKNKFGQGFTILVKLKLDHTDQDVPHLKRDMEHIFNSCVLKDEHQGMLQYYISDPRTPWPYLFRTMEHVKNTWNVVEDYSISETTLEQVFLSFARGQREDASQIKKRRCKMC